MRKNNKTRLSINTLLFTLLVSFSMVACESDQEKRDREYKELMEHKKQECTNKQSAFWATKGYVKSRLKVPSSAIFSDERLSNNKVHGDDCRHIVKATFESKNSFGVLIKQQYRAEVHYIPLTNNWVGKQLDIW